MHLLTPPFRRWFGRSLAQLSFGRIKCRGGFLIPTLHYVAGPDLPVQARTRHALCFWRQTQSAFVSLSRFLLFAGEFKNVSQAFIKSGGRFSGDGVVLFFEQWLDLCDGRSIKSDRFRVSEGRFGAFGGLTQIMNRFFARFRPFKMKSQGRGEFIEPIRKERFYRFGHAFVQFFAPRNEKTVVSYIVSDGVFENVFALFRKFLSSILNELTTLQFDE